jgi:hypothetical protein
VGKGAHLEQGEKSVYARELREPKENLDAFAKLWDERRNHSLML